MKNVYIAHPLRGNLEANKQRVTKICQDLLTEGRVTPISPIHAFSFITNPNQDPVRDISLCFNLLKTVDELWVYGQWWRSEGCRAEISFANCRSIPIIFKEYKPGDVIVSIEAIG